MMAGKQVTCFQEADSSLALWRRSTAECLGTFLLVLAAAGSGIAAAELFPEAPGTVLPIVALVLSSALVSLIVAFGQVSGGHYNPLITVLQWLARERSGACTISYVAAQCLGGLAGGLVSSWLWQARATHSGGLAVKGIASEVIASAALMLIVFGCMRGGRVNAGPFAVGAWLIAGVIATPTTSFANPAVVLGAALAAGPFGLGPHSVLPYVAAEFGGALVALLVVAILYPTAEAQA